jgi:hypothetical protein
LPREPYFDSRIIHEPDSCAKLFLQDDICYPESEILLANNIVGKLEASSLQLHGELATLHEQLKAAQEGQKTAEVTLAKNEALVVQRVEIATKLLDDNLNAISSSVKAFTAEIFGKSPAALRNLYQS